MPITVETPIHLIVDEAALRGQREEIESAISRAMVDVMTRARLDVLDDRGGYYGVRLMQPEFRWSGLEIPGIDREAFENKVWSLILDSAENSGTFALAQDADNATLPLSEEATEIRDAGRHIQVLRQYRLPRYNDGEEAQVPVDGEEPEGHWERHWQEVDQRRIDPQHLWDTLASYVSQMPPTEPTGLVFLLNRSPLAIGIFVVNQDGAWMYHAAGNLVTQTYNPSASAFRDDASAWLPPDEGTLFKIEFGPDDAANGEMLRSHMENEIRMQLGHLSKPDVMTGDEFTLAVDQAVTNELKRRARGLANRTIFLLEMSGRTLVTPVRAGSEATVPFTLSANVFPFDYETHVDGPAPDAHEGTGGSGEGGQTGSGGSGQGGSGARGDRAGSGQGGGTGGSPIFAGGGTGTGEFHFPGTGGADPVSDVCQAYNGEPDCDSMGHVGELFKKKINEIASRLQIETCYYPAHFSIYAAQVVGARTAGLINYALASSTAFYQPVQDRSASIDTVRIRPTVSPAVQLLRYLGGTVKLIGDLQRMICDQYDTVELRDVVTKDYYSNIASWILHYMIDFTDVIDASVADLFRRGCTLVMLEMLETSRQQIQGRITHFDVYGPMFTMMVQKWLRQPAELSNLRDLLNAHNRAQAIHTYTDISAVLGTTLGTVAADSPAGQWIQSAHSLAGVFLQAENLVNTSGGAGSIVEVGGVARIRDSLGRLWSMSELEDAVVTLRGTAEDIDPLIKQIRDLPDTFSRFQDNPNDAQYTIYQLLQEMIKNNEEMTDEVRTDSMFAFRASTMIDSIEHATISGSTHALSGIHLQVHQLIGESFQGSVYYQRGVDFAMNAEQGFQSLKSVVIGTELVILCVLCPPAGFLVGATVALQELSHAYERERLYMSFIDPELVLTRAEVEVGKFAAWIGVALAFIPEAGTILGSMRAGLRGGLRAGLRVGAAEAAEYVAARMTRQIVEALEHEFLPAFVREMAINEVANRLIQTALEPILEAAQREASISSSPGGTAGAQQILNSLRQGRGETTGGTAP